VSATREVKVGNRIPDLLKEKKNVSPYLKATPLLVLQNQNNPPQKQTGQNTVYLIVSKLTENRQGHINPRHAEVISTNCPHSSGNSSESDKG
jgi:hypothetical protein